MKKSKYISAIASAIGIFILLLIIIIGIYTPGASQNKKQNSLNDKNSKKAENILEYQDPSIADQKSSVISFNSDGDKESFLKSNLINSNDLIQIPSTNSYQINLSQEQLSELNNQDKIKIYPNVIYRATATPNDELYSQQWNLAKVSAPSAWDISKSSASIKIAVIDTGFAKFHQDLVNKFDLASGYDFANNDSDVAAGTTNINGAYVYHGTAAASLAAADTNNSVGLASLGWDSRIIPIQSLSDDGFGNTFTVSAGIYHAVNNGAGVISLSLGSTVPDSFLENAINYAISNNVIVVAASGNESCNCINYPANYSSVIAVGSSDPSDVRSSFSNFGNNLDVVAPGSGGVRAATMNSINQTTLYSSNFSGTSSSTPQVAGLAALIKSLRPSSTQAEVESYIRNGADKVAGMAGQNFSTSYGYGRINATASLVRAGAYSWQLQSQSSDKNIASLPRGEKATLTVVAKNTGTQTWQNSGANPVRLATYAPQDRASTFYTSNWISQSRASNLLESEVAPGSNGTFRFEVQSGSAAGQYNEKFNLVAENVGWFNDSGLNFPITLINPSISAQIVSNSYTASSTASSISSSQIVIKNTGNVTWYKTGVYTADLYVNPYNSISPFQDASWISSAIASRMQESSVAPNSNATFNFNLKSPQYNGSYTQQYRLGITNLGWSSLYPFQNINVSGGTEDYRPVYRHYSPTRGSHFYTTDLNESNTIRAQGWNFEGIAWRVSPNPNSKPVYRHYSPSRGRHFYTTSQNESSTIRPQGWNYEGVAWYASETTTSQPIYRHYSPTRRAHFYTKDLNESNIIRSQGWNFEGIEYYAFL